MKCVRLLIQASIVSNNSNSLVSTSLISKFPNHEKFYNKKYPEKITHTL